MAAFSAPYTALTAGTLSTVYALLQLRVGLYRKSNAVVFGTKDSAGKEDLTLTAMARVGGNMQEYVPTGLILMLLMETQTPIPPKYLAAYGLLFTASRLSHAYALHNAYNPNSVHHMPPRATGFLTTIALLVAGGTYVALHGFKALNNK